MLTNKPWDEIASPRMSSLRVKGDPAEKAILQGYAQRYIKEISTVLNRVPRQMLLLFKCNDCLRHIDRALGAPVNSFCITALTTADALLAEETKGGVVRSLLRAPKRLLVVVWRYVRVKSTIR